LAAEVAEAGRIVELSLVQMEVRVVLVLEHSLELLVQELQVKEITEVVALVTVLMGLVMAVVVEVLTQQDKLVQEQHQDQVLLETVVTELHG
jgi:hypothetical protein